MCEMRNWLGAKMLQVNNEKTEVMLFTQKHRVLEHVSVKLSAFDICSVTFCCMVCQDEYLPNCNVSRMLQHALWLVLPVANTSPQFFGSCIGFLWSTVWNSRFWSHSMPYMRKLRPTSEICYTWPNPSECCGLCVPLLWKGLVAEVWSMVIYGI